ncbi:MAG: trehalase, partial [Silvibacterium sp.]|nr:trehalase [Silvibacterium sp.]
MHKRSFANLAGAAAFMLSSAFGFGQSTASASHQLSPKAEQGQPIDAYIKGAWNQLSRSMDECKSVADPKLATASILYLPANVPEPPEVAAMEKSCKVKVERLPRRIQHIGDIKPGEIAHAGLLYLPKKYVVP